MTEHARDHSDARIDLLSLFAAVWQRLHQSGQPVQLDRVPCCTRRHTPVNLELGSPGAARVIACQPYDLQYEAAACAFSGPLLLQPEKRHRYDVPREPAPHFLLCHDCGSCSAWVGGPAVMSPWDWDQGACGPQRVIASNAEPPRSHRRCK